MEIRPPSRSSSTHGWRLSRRPPARLRSTPGPPRCQRSGSSTSQGSRGSAARLPTSAPTSTSPRPICRAPNVRIVSAPKGKIKTRNRSVEVRRRTAPTSLDHPVPERDLQLSGRLSPAGDQGRSAQPTRSRSVRRCRRQSQRQGDPPGPADPHAALALSLRGRAWRRPPPRAARAARRCRSARAGRGRSPGRRLRARPDRPRPRCSRRGARRGRRSARPPSRPGS